MLTDSNLKQSTSHFEGTLSAIPNPHLSPYAEQHFLKEINESKIILTKVYLVPDKEVFTFYCLSKLYVNLKENLSR